MNSRDDAIAKHIFDRHLVTDAHIVSVDPDGVARCRDCNWQYPDPDPNLLTISINGQPITASMDEWAKVTEAVGAQIWADREAELNAKRRAGQVWYALYHRHWSKGAEECFSAEDAWNFLNNGSEAGDLAVTGVVYPDGHLELDPWLAGNGGGSPEKQLAVFAAALADARATTASGG